MSEATNNQGVISLSMAGAFYKAMATMTAYQREMMKEFLQFFQNEAKAQSETVETYVKQAVNAADTQAEAGNLSALSDAVQGGLGLAGVGSGLVTTHFSNNGEIEGLMKQKENVMQLQKDLEDQAPYNCVVTERAGIESRESEINRAKNGDLGGILGPDKEIVVAQLKSPGRGDDLDDVKIVVAKELRTLNKRLDSIQSTKEFKGQLAAQLASHAGSIAKGGASSAAALQQADGKKEETFAGVVNTIAQQETSQEQQTQQQANGFSSQADQTAASAGNTQQVRA